jgi:signal transduction histidine kinase/ActR/RegA family two-component response regulator
VSEQPELPQTPSPEAFARLERRLGRERRARLEAESIAEKGLRELWSGQRELRLLKMIAKTANEAKNSRAALAEALRLVCEFTEWPIGHVYLTRGAGAGRCMTPTNIWCGGETAALQAFRRESEARRFTADEGLPGRVLRSGQPAWSSPLNLDPQFPRGSLALKAGLRSGLAFPVRLGPEVAAALEFFTHQVLEPDEKLLEIMEKLGDNLGRAMERERAETRLKAKNRKLSRLLRQVEAQRQAADAANAAKSAFLAVTSHEVRTPLNAVLGLAEGLRRETLSQRQASLVDGIVESGSLLLRLLNSVLELSRIESGEVALEESDFALADLLDAVVRLWRGRADELGIALRIDTSGLPDPCWAHGDQGKLQQVLTNLISNALKFTPAGGAVTVRGAARAAGGLWRLDLEVADGGPGVPVASRLAIFEPYAQTAAGREAGGAGLGLTICAGHVRQMGGEIGVEDAPDGGALFRVRLALPAGGAKAPAAESPAGADPAGLVILVAEDNEPNRRVLQILLEPADVQLTFTENGAEALEAFRHKAFDLVLMDANMPVMGGVEAVRAIRSLPDDRARTPIHMITANAFEDDIRSYLAAGADGVLPKPIQVHQLYAVLSEVAARSAPEQDGRLSA